MMRMLAIPATFSATDVKILPLAAFPENRLFRAGIVTVPV